jgi:hypothetical protein
MRYLFLLALILGSVPGCVLVFDDNHGDDDVCLAGAPEPAALPAPQRNPETLTCESFGGGGGGCPIGCGPCAEAPSPPIPSWGACNGACESLSESECGQAAGCRVVKDAVCAVRGGCFTDFVGCFATDRITDPAVDCFDALDGSSCSRNAECTAYHRVTPAAIAQDARPFALCTPRGKSPGTCHGRVTCTAQAPACPTGMRAGVAAGCYTGSCIPLDICEPAPQP